MWYERLEVNRPIPPRAPSILHTGITYKDTPSRKRKHRDDPEDEDEPRHFCRVRLISYRNRTRKEAVEQPQPEANGMDVDGMEANHRERNRLVWNKTEGLLRPTEADVLEILDW